MEIASAAPESQLANLRRSAGDAGRTGYRGSTRSLADKWAPAFGK